MGFNDKSLTAFDFFAGGGGASLGLHRAGIDMLAALNHSPVAIATHEANFPGARHLLCDIRVQKSWGLGHADIMWASPDCTHHSIAKGGQSRDAKERALAEELPRFAYNLNVNCVMVENVKEFLDWGPVMEVSGKMLPDRTRKGEYYRAWLATMQALGFTNYEYRLLNAADFGVPQSRVRYFGIFTRKGVAIRWPQPTHDKHGRHGLPKWVAVRTVLDLDDKGRSIFTEWGKPIADKTLRRILAGLRKHVIGHGQREYLDKRSSNHPSGRPSSGASTGVAGPTIATCYLPDLVTPRFLIDPYGWHGAARPDSREAPTIIAQQGKAPLQVATARFMLKAFGGNPAHQSKPLADTTGAITCADHHQPVTACLIHHYSGGGQSSSLRAPHPASTCNPHGRLLSIVPAFVAQYNGGSDHCRVLGLDGATNTVPTENRFAQVSVARFVCGQYGKHHNTTEAQTCPPILTTPKQNVVTAAFLTQSNGVSRGVNVAAKTWRLDSASRTVTARPNQPLVQCLLQANGTRSHDDAARLTMPLAGQSPTLNTNGGNLHLMSYYGTGRLRPIGKPCATVPTKDRFAAVGFVTASHGCNPPYSLRRPAKTIVASRRHPYLVLMAPGSPVAAQPGDSVAMRLLKAVCRKHGIADIYMRMLKVPELKRIMGFPDDYYLAGGVTKQKEMLGNAVVPQVSEAIARAMTPSLLAARLRKLPKLRMAAINRWQQAEVFGKEVAHG